MLIQNIVNNCQSQIRLTDIINVWKNEANMRADRIPVLQDLVMLTANIPTRFLDMVEDFFELFRINRLQNNLSNIDFFFDFHQ